MNVPDHVQIVLDRLGDAVRPNGSGWVACCPAHEDGEPSLSIGIGQGGRVLLTCFAGCTFAEIVAGLGMTPAEMFPADDRKPSRGYGSPKPKKATATRPAESAPTGQVFRSPWDAVGSLADRLGRPEGHWLYRTPDDGLVGVVFRFATANGKTIRPAAKFPDGWRLRAMGEPRPLYCLPDLATADVVYIVEGEKCCRRGPVDRTNGDHLGRRIQGRGEIRLVTTGRQDRLSSSPTTMSPARSTPQTWRRSCPG